MIKNFAHMWNLKKENSRNQTRDFGWGSETRKIIIEIRHLNRWKKVGKRWSCQGICFSLT